MSVERPTLPYVQLTAWKGLHTKLARTALKGDQLITSQNTDYVKRYQAISKLKGARRILSTIYQESSVTKPIAGVMFYNYPDLDGQLLRHVLIAAGTTLQRVNTSSGALTSLATGRTSGLIHSWDMANEFLLIQNQNPRLVGQGDAPAKYDGHEVSGWGVEAPGDTIVEELEEFDDATDWTTDNATLANETTVTRDGTSLKVTQGSGGTEAKLTKDFGAGNEKTVNTTTDDRVEVKVYIDPEKYDDLRTSSYCLSFTFSSSAAIPIAANFYRFTFFIGQLNPGWTTLSMDFSTAPTGNTGSSSGSFNAASIRTLEISLFGAAASSGVIAYFDQLVELEDGEPSGTFSGVGSVFTNDSTNGIWLYRVTYNTKYNLESNAGPSLTMDNRGGAQSYAQVNLTGIPVSSDGQVVARKIYRTAANSGTFLLLTTINDNTTTTYTDTISDGSLGTATPPTSGSSTVGKDHSPPPRCGIVKEFLKTVFLAGDPLNPTLLYYSVDAQPEQFPLVNTFNLGEVITGMFETSIELIITTETGVWRLLGENPDWTIEKIYEGISAAGPKMVGTSRFQGWLIDRSGLRLFDGRTMYKPGELIRDKYDDLDKTNFDDNFTTHSSANNAILQFNKDSNGNVTSVFVFQYLADEVSQGGYWSELSFPASIQPLDATEIIDSSGDPRLYVGGNDGMLYEWLSDDSKNWVNASGTASAIDTIFETPYLRLGEAGGGSFGMTGRVQPRWLEVQVSGDATTWTATVYSADGVDQTTERDSVALTMAFSSGRSLLRLSIQQLHAGEFLKVRLRNNDSGVSSIVEAVRIYFYPRPGQFEVAS